MHYRHGPGCEQPHSGDGKTPRLADLLLVDLEFLHPKYIRGILGVMNTYVFDTRNLFNVKEGMTGIVDNCRVNHKD